MAFWGPIAASVAGNVVSGLFGGGKDGPSYNTQLWSQHHMNKVNARQLPKNMVRGAKAAGIHPALLFGAGGLPQPSWTVGNLGGSGSNGIDFGAIGQDVSRAIMAKTSADERAAELASAAERQAKADAIGMERHRSEMATDEMQRNLIAAQIKRLQVQSPPPQPSNTANVQITPYDPFKQTGTQVGKWESMPAQVTSADPDVQSLRAGPPQPGFNPVRIGGPKIGGIIEMPNQEMSEALESMGAAVAPAYVWGHQLMRGADRVLYGDPRTKPKGHKGVKWEWSRLRQRWIAKPERR